jgi:hypothetical protein
MILILLYNPIEDEVDDDEAEGDDEGDEVKQMKQILIEHQ